LNFSPGEFGGPSPDHAPWSHLAPYDDFFFPPPGWLGMLSDRFSRALVPWGGHPRGNGADRWRAGPGFCPGWPIPLPRTRFPPPLSPIFPDLKKSGGMVWGPLCRVVPGFVGFLFFSPSECRGESLGTRPSPPATTSGPRGRSRPGLDPDLDDPAGLNGFQTLGAPTLLRGAPGCLVPFGQIGSQPRIPPPRPPDSPRPALGDPSREIPANVAGGLKPELPEKKRLDCPPDLLTHCHTFGAGSPSRRKLGGLAMFPFSSLAHPSSTHPLVPPCPTPPPPLRAQDT